jgi:hypothetical protein
MADKVPPGWASEPLSAYLDMVRGNAFATFHNLRGEYALLARVDGFYLRFLEDFRDPPVLAAAPFAYRAHAGYRAACGLAISGQVPEAFMVMRGVLENALYANYIGQKPDAYEIWRKRGEGEVERKACVRAFSGKNLFDALGALHEGTRQAAGRLYERSIDLGAHPNEEGHFALMSVTETEQEYQVDTAYLSGDGPNLRRALQQCAHVGLIGLAIFSIVFPERFAEIGIKEDVEALRGKTGDSTAT